MSRYLRYPWPEGRTSAFCFTVDVDAESPYLWGLLEGGTQALGTMEQRLFGPRTGIWRLLDLLDRRELKGTFFVPGVVAEAHPDLLPAFVERGHEIGLHGYFHEIVADTPQDEFVAALDAALAVFARQVGVVPKGFRSPAWEMTPAMLAELSRRGLYDSSLMGFDHPYTIDGVTEVPVQWAVDDAVYFKFTGGGADRWAPAAQGGILDAWLDEWEVLHREGGLLMLTVHDWISGRAGRIRMLERLLDRVASTPGAWVATVGEVAAHHAAGPARDAFAVASRVPEPSGPAPLSDPALMQTFSTRKPAVRSPHGLVAAQNRHAAEAGAAVLSRGGNATDAAVTAALVLSVVEPWLSGIGGGGFLLHADGRTGAVEALDFNVRAASGLDPADYPLAPGCSGNWFQWPGVVGDRNVSGYGAVCVPGAVAGFAAALERHGTISFADALAPAIAQARRGLEIDWFAALCIAVDAANLAGDPASAALLLDEGRAPRASSLDEPRFKPMPAKLRLLERLAAAGARDFYEGEAARTIAADLAAGGSPISAADLAAYRPHWRPALRGRYRQFGIAAVPGLSAGPSWLDAAARLADSPLSAATGEAEAALITARAIRDTYAERLTTMGHAAAGPPSCTSHVSVVDRDGTMVSLTNTLLSRFGARLTLPGAGFLVNNGMMWFDPRPGQPNGIAPGAQPLANMCPLVLLDGGRPVGALGAAGGRTIFPTLLQLVSGLADFGLSLEEVFHRPRIDASTPRIRVDARAAPDVAAAVATAFPVEIVEDTLYPVHFAIPSAVMREGDDGFVGMAHPGSPWAAVAAATA